MTQEYTEPLKIQHRQILSKIEQYAAKADAVADRPARLRRQMEEMQGELDRERSDLERERLNAQALGRTVEEQLQAARVENEQLRNQLQYSNNARDAALRDLEQSSDRQRLLQRDLRSALAELETLRLELNLLRPYEVRPLPSAAAQVPPAAAVAS